LTDDLIACCQKTNRAIPPPAKPTDTVSLPKPQDNTTTKIHPVLEFLWKEWRVIKSPSFWIIFGLAAM
jgi:hypothetical protein